MKPALVLIILLAFSANAYAVTREWTGAVDNQWSTPGNWSPAGTPASGDSLTFPSGSAASTNNDLDAAVVLGQITFGGPAHTVSGNAIRLSSTLNGCGKVTLNVPVQAEANDLQLYALSFAELDPNGYTIRVRCGEVEHLVGTGDISLDPAHTFTGSHSFSGTIRDGSGSGAEPITLANASFPSARFFISKGVNGTGTIGVLQASGWVEPSNGQNPIGAIATSDLELRMALVQDETEPYFVDIGAAGNDVLEVTGAVAVWFKPLQVRLIGNYMPLAGAQFTIINNDGTDAVTGTKFYWKEVPGTYPLPEGAEFTVDGTTFRISYVGGTGNDVVLTVTSPSYTSNTSLSIDCEQTCDATPTAVSGQPITLNATVSSSPAPNNGTVSFYGGANGDVLLGTKAVSEGAASLTLSQGLTPGSYAFVAKYSGSNTHTPSTSPAASLMVGKAPTRMEASAEITGIPAKVQITAYVLATGLGGGAPSSGAITIAEGGLILGTPGIAAGHILYNLQLDPGVHHLTLTFAGNGSYEASSTSLTVTIAQPILSADPVTAHEGSGREHIVVEVKVRLSNAGGVVTVEYATSDGTARAGVDYESTSGSLTFALGETEKSISIALVSDDIEEPDETFFLRLREANGAVIATDPAQITIVNDDKWSRRRSVRR